MESDVGRTAQLATNRTIPADACTDMGALAWTVPSSREALLGAVVCGLVS